MASFWERHVRVVQIKKKCSPKIDENNPRARIDSFDEAPKGSKPVPDDRIGILIRSKLDIFLQKFNRKDHSRDIVRHNSSGVANDVASRGHHSGVALSEHAGNIQRDWDAFQPVQNCVGLKNSKALAGKPVAILDFADLLVRSKMPPMRGSGGRVGGVVDIVRAMQKVQRHICRIYGIEFGV